MAETCLSVGTSAPSTNPIAERERPPIAASPGTVAQQKMVAMDDEQEQQPQPIDPSIECFHVADRKVYVPKEGEPSVYSICRQWVRGIPAPDMSAFLQESTLLSTMPDLPEPGPPFEEDPFDHPPLPGAELYEIETKDPKTLLQLHKEHWVRVRNYHIAKQRFKCQRYKERVKIVCDYAASAVREAKRS